MTSILYIQHNTCTQLSVGYISRTRTLAECTSTTQSQKTYTYKSVIVHLYTYIVAMIHLLLTYPLKVTYTTGYMYTILLNSANTESSTLSYVTDSGNVCISGNNYIQVK
jgi:hypothetical protein